MPIFIEDRPDEPTDLVERVERAARRCGWPGTYFVSLATLSDANRRLRVLSSVPPVATSKELTGHLTEVLREYHSKDGVFPVYLIPIGEDYKLSGKVTEIRTYPPQRSPRGHADTLVTHPFD